MHPESRDIVDKIGLQISNDKVKQHIGMSRERKIISEHVKRSRVKSRDITSHIEQTKNFGMLATIPTNVKLENNLGISSRKVGIASILEQNFF